MRQNKKQYLPPTIVAVAFKVEVGQMLSGHRTSAIDITEFTTENPSAAASAYTEESEPNWPIFQ